MDHTKLAHVLAHMKYLTVDGKELFMPEKVYKNPTWMNSSAAKQLRIMSEIIEPDQRLAAAGVHKSILFFGSARAKSEEDHAAASAKAAATLASAGASEADKEKARISLGRLSKTAWMCDVYVQVEQLARKLTEWSMGRIGATGAGVPYIISTGGGPGLMEAANRGASSVPGAITAGIAISLPFEQGINRFVTVSRAQLPTNPPPPPPSSGDPMPPCVSELFAAGVVDVLPLLFHAQVSVYACPRADQLPLAVLRWIFQPAALPPHTHAVWYFHLLNIITLLPAIFCAAGLRCAVPVVR